MRRTWVLMVAGVGFAGCEKIKNKNEGEGGLGREAGREAESCVQDIQVYKRLLLTKGSTLTHSDEREREGQ